ncbi:MAG: hypothetical protein IT363_11880 [Methanoregulaceae archaeon]|nr:hypothetical protein [Methanoregulaceae archaeon]
MTTTLLLVCMFGPGPVVQTTFVGHKLQDAVSWRLRDAPVTAPVLDSAIPAEEAPDNGTKLTFKSGSNSYELDLPSGWSIQKGGGPNLASATKDLSVSSGGFRLLDIYESTLEKAQKRWRFTPEAKVEYATYPLTTKLGKVVVFEVFVPQALASDGGTYNDHILMFALTLPNGRNVVLRFHYTFAEQVKEEAGVYKTVGMLSLTEARQLLPENRRYAEKIVSTLRKGSGGSASLGKKPTPFSSTSLTLGGTKCLVSVPQGRSLKSVPVIVINIPPSGSAKVLAPSDCARRGWGSVALTGLDTSDPMKLRDRSASVLLAIDKLREKTDAKFIFSGFSAGGFAAAALAKQYEDRCVGLITIGSFTAAQYLPADKGLPIVFLLGSKDFNRSQALQVQRNIHSDGWNVQVVTFEGGHSWGSTKEHEEALEVIAGGKR